MSFVPVVPLSGYAGWAFLQRTQDSQQDAFNSSSATTSATTYFRENIGAITRAEDLVADRRLLSVALDAFGLSDQINSKALIRQVLESSTFDPESLANRLSDDRYLRLAEAFGFGDFDTPNTQLSTFADEIIEKYQTQSFERVIGEQNQQLGRALGFERELAAIVDDVESEDAVWFSILGTKPLREVFEGAFGLPASTGALDIDRQLEIFKTKAQSILGSSDPSDLVSTENQEIITRRYLALTEIQNGTFSPTVPGSAALAILTYR